MSLNHAVLLVGGPDAGKTNYITRLWLAIREGKGSLCCDGLPDDLEYLEGISEHLLTGMFAPRTHKDDGHRRVEIPVKNANNSFYGTLIVPDCSGEEWQDIYSKREWAANWEDIIAEATGCLIFLRVESDQVVPPIDWINCSQLFVSPGDITGDFEVPTQVVLTDWLQCLHQAFSRQDKVTQRPKIGIVVSAWDLAPAEIEMGPVDAYLEENYPLFYQYLQANDDIFDCEVFGVSITACDLNNEAMRGEYLEGSPQKVGYVIHSLNGEIVRSQDLTIPVAWAMGLF